jgi:anti-sigma factor RsiW
MGHISEKQISAYIDSQLNAEECRGVKAHLENCAPCRALHEEMLETTLFFRRAERLQPSPFLWNRIEAGLDAELRPKHGWGTFIAARLRNYGLGLNSAAIVVAISLVIALGLLSRNSNLFLERAALAEIDRTQKSLAAYDPDVYNPFSSGPLFEPDTNPFKNLRLKGGAADTAPAQRH